MKHTIGKVMNILSTVLVVLLALVLVAVIGFRIFGLQGYKVLSGSMEPEYPTGSVIYVKEVDTKELKEGDVITFYLAGKTEATHRIHEVVEENGTRMFRTKGDANEQPDAGLVNPDDVIGSPVFTVPYMGYALTYMQTTRGMYVAIAVGAAVLLLILLPPLLLDKGEKKKEK